MKVIRIYTDINEHGKTSELGYIYILYNPKSNLVKIGKPKGNMMKQNNYKILCLDQATKITGYSIFIGKKLDTYGLLKVSENEKNPIERIKQMNEKIIALINDVNPNYIVFEQVHFNKNYGTFQQLSQLQGVIMSYLFQIDIGFTLIEPTAWKSCCGIKGRKRTEQKANTILFVKNQYNIDVSEDEADAIGIGYWTTKNLIRSAFTST